MGVSQPTGIFLSTPCQCMLWLCWSHVASASGERFHSSFHHPSTAPPSSPRSNDLTALRQTCNFLYYLSIWNNVCSINRPNWMLINPQWTFHTIMSHQASARQEGTTAGQEYALLIKKVYSAALDSPSLIIALLQCTVCTNWPPGLSAESTQDLYLKSLKDLLQTYSTSLEKVCGY